MLELSSATKILGTGFPWRRPEQRHAHAFHYVLQHPKTQASTNSKDRSATVVSRVLRGSYQGISFFTPFFFLLVDSSFGSALSAGLAASALGCAVVAAGVEPAAGGAVAVDPAPAGGATAVEPIGLPSLPGAGFAETPGPAGADAVGVKTGTLLDGVKVEPVDGAGLSAAGAGVVATAFGSFGADIISNPMLFPGAEGAPAGTVVASTGAASAGCSGPAAEVSVPETVNAGPLAPGFKISVAETESFGGLICGVPAWAANVTSGLPLSMLIGVLISAD